MSDLEKFLQQAAERMKQRMQQQGAAPSPQQPQKPPKQKQQQPPRAQKPIQGKKSRKADPEQEDADHHTTVGGHISGRGPVVSRNVDQADERMSAHLHDTFDHKLGTLGQKPIGSVNDAGSNANLQKAKSATMAETHVETRDITRNPIFDMLTNSDSIQAAFIASEIFKRKF